MSGFGMFWRYLGVGVRGQMLYPDAFLLRLCSQFVVTIVEFAGVWALFARFHHVRGWSFAEVALFYAMASMAFALGDALSRGFDSVGPLFIKTGNFDRLLLRPRSTALQVTAQDLYLSSVGRMLQGLVVFAFAVTLLKPHWGLGGALLLAWSVAGGGALFYGLKTLEGTFAFWTTEGLEVANTLTYGGEAAAEFPLDIYAAWFRRFLTYFVPIGCSLYLPIALLLGHDTGTPPALAALAPVTGFAFAVLALRIWRIGVGHYTSTGS